MSEYDGVHSCGPNCTQPLCVANRRIAELEQEKTTLIKLGQEDSRYQNLLSETQYLRAKVEELTTDRDLYKATCMANDTLIAQLQAKVEKLTARLDLLEANNFQHSKPYMVCVPKEIWAVAFQKQEGE
jgi:chromosome segregation ATPase